MKRSILLLCFVPLVYVEVTGDIGTHVFVSERMNWKDAQAYCREKYSDLSIVRNPTDTEKILQAAGPRFTFAWIGLYRDLEDVNGWKWFEGGHVTYSNWERGEPNNWDGKQNRAIINSDGKWHDIKEGGHYSFFCFKFPGLEEDKKSWEEALDHCGLTGGHLISIVSDTDRRLIQRELQHRRTDLLWIGLRFLGDRWLWVNGDPLVDLAWPEEGDRDHQCPVRKRCGALDKNGQWQNVDCAEKLNFLCSSDNVKPLNGFLKVRFDQKHAVSAPKLNGE